MTSAKKTPRPRLQDVPLAVSAELCQDALRLAPFGFCLTGLDRRVVFMNADAAALLGLDQARAPGTPVAAYYPSGEDLTEEEVKKLLGGATVSKEMEFARPDGLKVPVLAAYAYVESRDGASPCLAETYTDLTDRKRLDDLKNEFVFIAAHELRSPVTAIKLLIDLIFDDKRVTIDHVLRDYLTKLHEAEERLLQLVDDLLEVSRTEVGRLKIKLGEEDLAANVLAVIGDLRASALARGVTIRYDQTLRPPSVLADPNKLREILINLVSNAVKYNVPGGTVSIDHERRDGLVFTTVRDTGIGISSEDQEKLFSKFWRSDDFAVRSQPGTGLGLFIVKELAERMGGSVKLESERGKGTTVTFSLPVVGE